MCEDDAGTLFEYYYSYTDEQAQAAGFSIFGESYDMIKDVIKTIAEKNVLTEIELINLEFELYDVTYETAQHAFATGYKAARDEITKL